MRLRVWRERRIPCRDLSHVFSLALFACCVSAPLAPIALRSHGSQLTCSDVLGVLRRGAEAINDTHLSIAAADRGGRILAPTVPFELLK